MHTIQNEKWINTYIKYIIPVNYIYEEPMAIVVYEYDYYYSYYLFKKIIWETNYLGFGTLSEIIYIQV